MAVQGLCSYYWRLFLVFLLQGSLESLVVSSLQFYFPGASSLVWFLSLSWSLLSHSPLLPSRWWVIWELFPSYLLAASTQCLGLDAPEFYLSYSIISDCSTWDKDYRRQGKIMGGGGGGFYWGLILWQRRRNTLEETFQNELRSMRNNCLYGQKMGVVYLCLDSSSTRNSNEYLQHSVCQSQACFWDMGEVFPPWPEREMI